MPPPARPKPWRDSYLKGAKRGVLGESCRQTTLQLIAFVVSVVKDERVGDSVCYCPYNINKTKYLHVFGDEERISFMVLVALKCIEGHELPFKLTYIFSSF